MNNINSNTYFHYLRLGMSLRPIRGKCDSLADLDYAYSIHLDGVQYVMNDFGEFEETNDGTDIMGCINNLEYIANSHRHDIILHIQQFIEKNLGTPVWSMVGMDDQMSVTFGSTEGYVAQLIMDFTSVEKFEEYKEKITQSLMQMGIQPENLPEINDIEEFVLIPAESSYDVMFGNLNCPGVVVDYFDGDSGFFFDEDEDEDD